jgi:RNA polymerase sigma-70 factor (ECF subfamily)
MWQTSVALTPTVGAGLDLSLASPEASAPTAREVEDAEDARLMAAFCGGDQGAFVALHARHAQPLHAYLRRMVNDKDMADDLLQTTFLSMVTAAGRFRPGTSVRAWLYAIAANAARDALRRGRVRTMARAALLAESDASFDPATPDPAAARAVHAALDRLPPDQREAVLLHKVHGLSFDEVATALQISLGAAKVRAHRGYEKLREALARFEDGGTP